MLFLTVGLLIALLVKMLLRMQTKASAINQAFKNTEYAGLIPLIVAMAKHETGNFASKLYMDGRNMFGMKMPSRRPTVARPLRKASDGGVYAGYSSDYNSAKDLLLWMQYTKFPAMVSTPESFATALKERGYYTDTLENYSKALRRWLAV